MLYTDKPFDAIEQKIKDNPDNFEFYNALFYLCNEEELLEPKMDKTKRLKALCRMGIQANCECKEDLIELFRETLLIEAKCLRFDSYMQYIELDREPEKRFWLPRRKQLLGVCNSMQDLIDDKLDVLTISLPPGVGKTTLENFLHSMLIGAHPDKPSLASGHSGTLTKSIYTGVLEIITDPVEYKWADVFPAAGKVITDAKEQTIDLGKKHRFASLTCRPINGSLTGATRCEQLLSADDMVSGIEEAMNIERLDKLWFQIQNDLFSRKKLGCKTLALATRWSVHDPIGRLQRDYEDDERARFIVVPALNEKNESNFDYQYGVGFDTPMYLKIKKDLDEVSFKALYMNMPIEREGLLYEEQMLRRYFELPDEEPDAIISVCDTKDKGVDYCVHIVGYVYGDDYYIQDVLCDPSLPEVVEGRIVNMMMSNKVQMSRFESNSAGGRIAEKIQGLVKEQNGITKITTKYSTQNKETRIIVASQWVKEHCLFKDQSKYMNGDDYGRFMQMLCSFSHVGKHKHDDAPDAMAMFADFAQSLNGQKVEIFHRFF